MTGGRSPTPQPTGFTHVALFYADDRAYLDATVPFVHEGVQAGEPVLVAVPERRARLLRDALGPAETARIRFAPMEQLGANPARIIPAWHDFVSDATEAAHWRGIGEPVWAGRTPDEVHECHHHEALLNLAFADVAGFTLLCPYAVRELAPAVLAAARATHPYVIDQGAVEPSDAFTADPRHQSLLDDDLPAPPPGALERIVTVDDLPALRREVADLAHRVGVPPGRVDDVQLAVSELCANSVLHGAGPATLHAWTDGVSFVCEVRDSGGPIGDPLVGRVRPPADRPTGRGLFLVHQLCDLVQLRSSSTGTVVRIRLHLHPATPDPAPDPGAGA